MSWNQGGYMGKVLLVDLSQETAEEYSCPQALGGKFLAKRILLNHLQGTEDAFSDENWLILSTGPLTGTGVPSSVRFEITAISPKTGFPVSSNCGGDFGVYLKKAGLDGVILKGKCASRRWIEIHNGTVRFHDASALWGMKTSHCQALLSAQHCTPFSSLCIGPAGEDLLPSATVICGDRAAGRAGLGAVLGWKNVKAITASGFNTIPVFNRENLVFEVRNLVQEIRRNPLTSDPQKVSGCPGCPIRCKKPDGTQLPFLNELGIDSMDAPSHRDWLREKHRICLEPLPGKPSGKRKNKVYHSILRNLNLQDREAVFLEYQALTETISALGLCIFSLIPFLDPNSKQESSGYFPLSDSLPRLLQYAAGVHINSDDLLALGKEGLQTAQTLRNRFPKGMQEAE